MLFLKIMSSEDLADSNPGKNFELHQIATGETLRFEKVTRADSGSIEVHAVITREDGDEQRIVLRGNAYVMNDNGVTIASRASY